MRIRGGWRAADQSGIRGCPLNGEGAAFQADVGGFDSRHPLCAREVQLGVTPARHAGGCGFDPHTGYHGEACSKGATGHGMAGAEGSIPFLSTTSRWGHMFQGGEPALQVSCGGFDSLWLHHL